MNGDIGVPGRDDGNGLPLSSESSGGAIQTSLQGDPACQLGHDDLKEASDLDRAAILGSRLPVVSDSRGDDAKQSREASVVIDLTQLGAMHPLLPAETAVEYAHRAAVALERGAHQPGVQLALDFLGRDGPVGCPLHWALCGDGDHLQLDEIRITEDGAEAIALSLVSVFEGLTVLRRLQRGEFADWLLRSEDGTAAALEVSGQAGTLDSTRVAKKRAQASLAAVSVKLACVVAFGEPESVVVSA